jgi:hypothetical protein
MPEILNAQQLIRLAQCLTQMQLSLTDYELRHYMDLTTGQKNKMEGTLTQLAIAAGRMYAYSVQLAFKDAEAQLKSLSRASDNLKKFLKTAQEIQQVLDIVSNIASLAEAIISHDPGGIASGIDGITKLVSNS